MGSATYESTRYRIGGKISSSSRARVQAQGRGYLPGARVRAYYNPARPEEAVLRRGAGGAVIGKLIATSCFAPMMVLALLGRIGGRKDHLVRTGGKAATVLIFVAVLLATTAVQWLLGAFL